MGNVTWSCTRSAGGPRAAPAPPPAGGAGARAAAVKFLNQAWGTTHDGEPCPPARYAGWSVVLTGSASHPINFVDAAGGVYKRRKDAARAVGILAGPLSESATTQHSKYAKTPFGDQRALLLESGTPSPPAVVSAAAAFPQGPRATPTAGGRAGGLSGRVL